ncbi:MAG TPA: DUF2892 domain-containing protein [Termitinemataceae bacterium]|nr:DUF2892 domain-containing protein [Termitinemataceae bacterium]HOM24035.1 DUF2892 domain-containing protein [Termitinemataceae bacterium]HPQ00967.1 DUF2892 domain-containing protein [Termitinemataceae bacterium]
MKQNMGLVDRLVRVVLALVVGVLVLTGQLTGVAAVILGIFAVVFLLTSAVGFCPLYVPLGISTKKKSSRE